MNTMNQMNTMNLFNLTFELEGREYSLNADSEESWQKSMLTLQPSTTGLKKTQEKSIGYFTILKCTK